MKRRVMKYVLAWFALNVVLSMLWVFLGVPPQWAFVLGMTHGGMSQVGLSVLFVRRSEA